MMDYYGPETVGGQIWNSGRVRWGKPLDRALLTLGSKQMNANLRNQDFKITLFILDDNRIIEDCELDAGFADVKDAIHEFVGDKKFYLDYVLQIEVF